MGLLFIDSFDDRTTANAIYKWTTTQSTNTIGTAYGRNSTYGLYLSGDGNQYIQKSLGVNSTIYLGFALRCEQANWVADTMFYALYESSSQQCYINIDFGGHIRVYAGGTLLATSSLAMTTQTWHFLESKWIINATTGAVIIKVDGVEFVNLTNVNTRQGSGNAWIDSIRFRSGWNQWSMDDLWIADDKFYGDCRVECIRPTGAGNYSQFTPLSGANYTNVDDASSSAPCPDGDTTYNENATVGNIDTFVFANLATTSGIVYGVQIDINAEKTDAGARSIVPLIRQSSTDYEGSSISLAGSYNTYPQMFLTNPATSAAWTIADINTNAEFGYKDKA